MYGVSFRSMFSFRRIYSKDEHSGAVHRSSYSIHQSNHLEDQLILPQVIPILEDDWIFLSLRGLANEQKRKFCTLKKGKVLEWCADDHQCFTLNTFTFSGMMRRI